MWLLLAEGAGLEEEKQCRTCNRKKRNSVGLVTGRKETV